MNLTKLGNNTYVLLGNTNIGFYTYDNNSVAIIDTGSSKEDGKNILDICTENKWIIKMIINTHSHADHIGGNNYIQEALNIPIYANGVETFLIENPLVQSTMAYGGYPSKLLRSPFLMASPSKAMQIEKELLPKGLSFDSIPGHCGDMISIKTSDDVYFLGDVITGLNVIEKYQVQFTFDIDLHLQTLDKIRKYEATYFVPSHGNIGQDINELVDANIKNIDLMIELLKSFAIEPITFDKIMKNLFDHYHLKMNPIQYNVVSATVRCYLSYMLDQNIIKNVVDENLLLWVAN